MIEASPRSPWSPREDRSGRAAPYGAVAWYLLISRRVWLIVGPIIGRTHRRWRSICRGDVIEAVALALFRGR